MRSAVCNAVAEADDGGHSKKLGLRVQKKLIGKMATKKTVKAVIDDDTYQLIDGIHCVAVAENGAKFGEKFTKDLIKITVKIGLLFRNDQFNKEEIALMNKFRNKLHSVSMTVVSFHEVAFTYDRGFLTKSIGETGDLIHQLVRRHLTEKSHKRIDNVFGFLGSGDMLDKLFQNDGAHHHYLETIVPVLSKLIDEDKI